MGILWLIIIGFVAGIIAKFLHPGSNEPAGFILTTALGIAGAFVATYLGQALGWYHAGEGAGLIGAVVGAVIVLVVWGFFNRLLHIPKRTTVPILNWKFFGWGRLRHGAGNIRAFERRRDRAGKTSTSRRGA